jgi:hypothetical protein
MLIFQYSKEDPLYHYNKKGSKFRVMISFMMIKAVIKEMNITSDLMF